VSIFIQVFLVFSEKLFYFAKVTIRLFKKVIDFGANRKRVCDFLLISHSNLGPVLHRFGDIEGFCAPVLTLFHHNFGGVPVAPDCPYWG